MSFPRSNIAWHPRSATILFAAIVIGCDQQPTPPSIHAGATPALSVVGDPGMGSLSEVAVHVVAGLRDSAVRARVRELLLDTTNAGVGLDLQDCGPSGRAGGLLRSAEHQGGLTAAAMCAKLARLHGAVLYMDRDRLARWDASTIPIVTAVAQPDQRLPDRFLGYRSPSRTIELTADGNVAGPLLVVLPLTHRSRARARSVSLPPVRVIRDAQAPGAKRSVTSR